MPNFQDQAEAAEFKKGEEAGEAKDSRENSKKSSRGTRGGKGRGKGKQNNPEDGSADTSGDSGKTSVSIYTGGPNPIDMHSFNPAYLDALAKIEMEVRSGYPIWDNYGSRFVIDANWAMNNTKSIGGILNMRFIPTIGETANLSDGINLGLISTFNKMRAATSGTQYFEAPDVGIYVVALANAIAYYGVLCKIYGLMTVYTYDNAYLPEALLSSMGINVRDLQKHSEDFRGAINLFGHALSQFRLPTGFQYVNRMVWMNSNVYKDAEPNNAQIYNFLQMSFYQLQEGITAHGMQYYYKKQVKTVNTDLWYLKLIPAPWTPGGVSVYGVDASGTQISAKELIDFGYSLLDPIQASQDCKHISAGFEKAYSQFVMVNPISELYRVKPIYEESVLEQVENATCLNGVQNYVGTIQEDVNINAGWLNSEIQLGFGTPISVPNNLKFSALVRLAQTWFADDAAGTQQAINSHMYTTLEPTDVMEYTRMMTWAHDMIQVADSAVDVKHAVNATWLPDAGSPLSINRWRAPKTYASNIFIGFSLSLYGFKDYNAPWKGINLLHGKLATNLVQVDPESIGFAYENTESESTPEVWADVWNDMHLITKANELAEIFVSALSQWDWHPRINRFKTHMKAAATVDAISAENRSQGELLDIASYAMIDEEQMTKLNRYDMLSQFMNANNGEYAVR